MQKFEDLFLSHRERCCSKWLHYFPIYDRHLSKFINQSITLLEIGVSKGGSLQLWKKYLGKNSKIVGIDIHRNSFYLEDQIDIFIGDQSNTSFLEKVLQKIDSPCIIIDDGSHIQSDILKTFNFLFPFLSDNGIYIIEDCHTAYWPRFEGGINSHLNVVDIFSKSAHDVNTKWYNLPRTPKIKKLDSISFYDSMIVFEKRTENYNRFMIDVDVQGPKIMETV